MVTRTTRSSSSAAHRATSRPPSRPVRPRRPRRRPPIQFALLTLVALGALVLLLRRDPGPASRAPAHPIIASVTPASPATPSPTQTPVTQATASSGLTTKVAALTAPLQGTYGVWGIDLSSGATFGQHEQQSFVAASVIKTYILVALYEAAAKGQLTLDEKVTTTSADIQNYGTGSIRYDPVGSSYTLAELARRAAKQSDNTAAYLLKNRLGEAAIQERTRDWGMTGTSIADDRTTPADIALLFSKVARRQLLPASSALDLLGLLTDTDFEDRLPALLPSYAIIAHKIGTEADGVINDAGLVVLPTRSYVLAVLTAGADPDQAIGAEQQLSQLVYTHEATLP